MKYLNEFIKYKEYKGEKAIYNTVQSIMISGGSGV